MRFRALTILLTVSLLALTTASTMGELVPITRYGIVVRHAADGTRALVNHENGCFLFQLGPGDDISPVIEQWVRGDQAAAKKRALMEGVLSAQVEQTCKAYHFNDQQKQKLLLAGRIDIRRLFETAEQLQQQLQLRYEKEAEFAIDDDDRKAAEPIRTSYKQFPFRQSDGLYPKVLDRILATERISPLSLTFVDEAELVKQLGEAGYYDSLVDFVDEFLGDAPLRGQRQHSQLAVALHRQLRGKPAISLTDPQIAWQKLAELPESTWKSALDQAQWERLNKKFQELHDAGEKN